MVFVGYDVVLSSRFLGRIETSSSKNNIQHSNHPQLLTVSSFRFLSESNGSLLYVFSPNLTFHD